MSLSPSELEKAIEQWVDYYNERRFHESLDNLTPRDVYLGLSDQIKKIREVTKQKSIKIEFIKTKWWSIKQSNYIRRCALLFDNVQIYFLVK